MAASSKGTSNIEKHQAIEKIFSNFISQRHNKNLNPLNLANIPVSEFSAGLRNYLSVLNEGGSIAHGRGEDLVSTGLSKSLESLFSTTTPFVREGPPLTWTSLVLFAGHQYEGTAQLQVGDSRIELSEDDVKLLRSGRPWRFLFPWPDKDDCTKELQLTKTAIQELLDARKLIDEVLEQISVVEQQLHGHHILVSRLSETKHQATQPGGLLLDVESSVLIEGVFGSGASAESENSVRRDSTSAPTTTRHVSNDRSVQPVNGELDDPVLPEDPAARNNFHRDVSRLENSASPGFRLHTSDFVQNLSEILDNPENGEIMRWSEDGQSVFIAPENKVPPHILAKISTQSYKSLIRRLYYFGFHKTGGAYHHDSFVRGQPSSIQPTRGVSHSPSRPSPLRNNKPRHGPRFKVIKRKRARESF